MQSKSALILQFKATYPRVCKQNTPNQSIILADLVAICDSRVPLQDNQRKQLA
jgi:hypothetical protein